MENPIHLPIKLQSSTFRPIAYRVLSKKHGLNIQSAALSKLADFVGMKFGNEWRGPKSQQFLEQVAKLWKEQNRGLFIDGTGIEYVIEEINNELVAQSKQRQQQKQQQQQQQQQQSNGNSIRRNTEKSLESLVIATRNDTLSDETNPIKIHEDPQNSQTYNADENSQMNEDEKIVSTLTKLDWRSFFKIINYQENKIFRYNNIRKQFDSVKNTNGESFILNLPTVKDNIELFTTRYYLQRDRLLRNDLFHPLSYGSISSVTDSNKNLKHQVITSIKNLLGRHGQRFLLFGLLTKNSSGLWQLQDETDTIILQLDQCIFPNNSYFIPGSFVLCDGIYSNSGKFYVSTISNPPAEKRSESLEAFGNIDFFDIYKNAMSSSSATKTNDLNINRIDFEVQSKLNLMEREYFEHRFIILGGDLFLNNFKILDAIKKLFAKLSNEIEMGDRTIAPLCIIINGPFTDVPFEATSSTNSISTRISSSGIYKSLFDSLANILEKFPNISQRSTLVFVPGDNDPWSSLVSKGSNSIWPRSKIPKIFVNRLNRVVKDIHWVSNPSNLIYLNHEIRIVRDDIGARLRRNDIYYLSKYNKDEEGDEVEENGASADNARKVTETLVDDLADEMENYDLEYNNLDNINDKDSLTIDKISDAGKTKFSADIIEARKIVKTILDQGHLSPFQSSVRPTIWNQDQSLWLLPLPTLLILTDTTSPAFDVTYEGCHVINPGSFINKNKITFIEYYPSSKKAELRSLYV